MSVFSEVIDKSTVCLNVSVQDSHQLVVTLIEAAISEGRLAAEHKDEAVHAVLKREQSASTAMPDGIALPHGRTDCVSEILCIVGIHPQGIAFGAPDNQPSKIFVLLLVPVTVGCNHIHFLANLSRRLMEQSVREGLLRATSRERVIRVLTDQMSDVS